MKKEKPILVAQLERSYKGEVFHENEEGEKEFFEADKEDGLRKRK